MTSVNNEDHNLNVELISVLTLDEDIESDVRSLEVRNNLFNFSTDSSGNVRFDKQMPLLGDKYHQNVPNKAMSLEFGFQEALENGQLIDNYMEYRTHKWTHFLMSLQKYDIIAKEEPKFVCFGGVISHILNHTRNWKTFAIKYKDVIYLYVEPNLAIRPDPKRSLESYFGINFLYLITNRAETEINEYDKYFCCDNISFGEHKIVVLNEIDAIDRNGNRVEAKCRATFTDLNRYRACLFADWTQCVVRDTKAIVYGKRSATNNSILKAVEVMKVEDVVDKCCRNSKDSKAFSFLKQSLDFIKNCIEDELILHSFVRSYDNHSKTIACSKLSANDHFLPEFYVNQ